MSAAAVSDTSRQEPFYRRPYLRSAKCVLTTPTHLAVEIDCPWCKEFNVPFSLTQLKKQIVALDYVLPEKLNRVSPAILEVKNALWHATLLLNNLGKVGIVSQTELTAWNFRLENTYYVLHPQYGYEFHPTQYEKWHSLFIYFRDRVYPLCVLDEYAVHEAPGILSVYVSLLDYKRELRHPRVGIAFAKPMHAIATHIVSAGEQYRAKCAIFAGRVLCGPTVEEEEEEATATANVSKTEQNTREACLDFPSCLGNIVQEYAADIGLIRTYRSH